MRIAFICQYYPPEIGAPAARVSEMSSAWAAQGHDVTVITGIPNHPTGRIPEDYQGVVFRKEQVDGVTIWRNWLFATPNEGLVKKTLSHLSFMISAAVLSTPRLRGYDVIIVSSPTFFSVMTAWFMSRLRRVPFVFEVRDLWPGIFIELGVLKNKTLIRVLEAAEMFLYRASSMVVVVTKSFAQHLRDRGLDPRKIATITNGVDGDFFRPMPADNDIRRSNGLSGKFVVLYIGAHGISHALHTVLDSAALTADDDDIRWVFVGEGAAKKALVQSARERGLRNVLFVPGQPRAMMPEWYAAADAALVPLRNIGMFETFIPSKMFEIMACGRPIVASVKGEARDILQASGAAVIVDPEDSAAVAEAVLTLKRDAQLRARLSASGRHFALAHYDRRELARQYLELLSGVVRSRAAVPTT